MENITKRCVLVVTTLLPVIFVSSINMLPRPQPLDFGYLSVWLISVLLIWSFFLIFNKFMDIKIENSKSQMILDNKKSSIREYLFRREKYYNKLTEWTDSGTKIDFNFFTRYRNNDSEFSINAKIFFYSDYGNLLETVTYDGEYQSTLDFDFSDSHIIEIVDFANTAKV